MGVATPLSTVELVEAFWLSLLGKLTDSTGWFSYSIHSHCICNGLYLLPPLYIYISELKMRKREILARGNNESGKKKKKEVKTLIPFAKKIIIVYHSLSNQNIGMQINTISYPIYF